MFMVIETIQNNPTEQTKIYQVIENQRAFGMIQIKTFQRATRDFFLSSRYAHVQVEACEARFF